MIRLIIGSLLGGLAQFLVGFVFWGTPLGKITFRVASDAQNADVQAALARNLAPIGAGTYYVPWPDTPAGTVMMGKGPVALIHFSPAGAAPMDTGALIAGLVLSILTIFMIGLALHLIAGRVAFFADRLRVLLLFAAATTLYFIVAQPVFNSYMPWGYWIYTALGDFIGLVAGGFVLVRWFLPRPGQPEAPSTLQ
ncbi:hypothetical protein [Sphingomonas quercus]|uniref:Uncharacterized protein n=1 Tax=Sphingomonas quercus TaxID=2842451 RepID=A0ABS6BI42_9SPHN|nr:hypothetical protein [Sphingomonas quercus]MBU3077975.1 hypothetical protein [Sphingomonas quercus]